MDLNTIWFVLLGVLLSGYAILDGFDLGVGILYFVARDERERRTMLNSIGPLWDGNEVWLVTFGGALFAAFPKAYATVFSAFYTPFMMLLCALIFRAVSLEFRGKRPAYLWRRFWDFMFFLSSAVAALLFGVAVGNAMVGIAIDANGNYQGTFFDFLNHPYGIAVGLLVVAMFAMHGAIFLYLKTEGALQDRIYEWMWTSFGLFMVMYILTTILILARIPHATANFDTYPAAWLVVVVNVLAIANIPRSIYKKRPGHAFLSSCVTILALNALFGFALYPNMVVAKEAANSLDVSNAASSETTLTIMLIIAAVGLPFVLAYTAIIYWTFRGKVKLGEFSY